MVSLQMMKPSLSPFTGSNFRDLNCFSFVEFDSNAHVKGILRLPLRKSSGVRKMYRVCCKAQEGDSQSNSSEERPESLFMKELRRRGITPTSLLEESSRTTIEEEIEEQGDDRLFSNRNAIATGSDKSLTNQRERSMALNSEGLEVTEFNNLFPCCFIGFCMTMWLVPDGKGLVPRAQLLLRLGGTFFLAFGPLMLLTIASFAALYLYFGPTFVHDASRTPSAPPQYVDPYELLQDERIAP